MRGMMQQLTGHVAVIAREADAFIMDIYSSDFDCYEKIDSSPLSEADHIICDGLAAISDLPILSVELPKEEMAWKNSSQWQVFWLVNLPLDETKELIKNGEFSVNFVLIDNRCVCLAVASHSSLNRLYQVDDS